MAAPTVRAYSTPTNGTDAAPAFTVTLPAGVTTGDLLLAFAANDTSGTAWTTSPGNNWVKIADETSAALRLGVYAKIADATNTLSIAAANNQDYSVDVVAIQVGTHGVVDVSTDIVHAAVVNGTSGNANPPQATGASKDWLAIAVAVVDMTATGDSISAYPSSYNAGVLTKSASSTSSVGLGVGHRALTAASSEDPGTFTNTSRAWLGKTLLIPPVDTFMDGAANGSIAWVGSSTGTTIKSGSVSGSIAWVGSATGAAPTGSQEGEGTGSIAWVGSADGEMPAGPGGIVQSKAQTGVTSLTFNSPTTAGNSIVVTCWKWASDINAGAITDNKSNTYTRIDGSNAVSPKSAIFFCENPTMGSSHQIIFSGDCGLAIWEVSGLASTPFDKSANNAGTESGVPAGVTTATLSQADEEVFAVICSDQSTAAITEASGENWTTVYEEENGASALCFSTVHKTVASTSAVSATWTLASSFGNSRTIATFKKAAAAGPNEGSASGSIAWVGSSTGVRTPTGLASGAIAWVGSATGAAPSSGTATIGYNVTGGSSDTTADNWINEATIGATYRHVAGTNEVVTSVSVAGGGDGSAEVGVYVYSGGVPTTKVGSATISVGTADQVWSTNVSWALTNGVTYVVAIDWTASIGATWTMHYDDPGGTNTSIGTGQDALPSTWSQASTSSGLGSYWATVTIGGEAPSEGSASGSIAWVGSATGEAPVIATGSASGAISWVGSSTGVRTPKGAATGAISWVGIATSFSFPYPVSISNRKWLDQNGKPYFCRTFSSWGMAQNLTDAEITGALEDVKANGFNGVTAPYGGPVQMGGWHKYTNAADEDFWTGTPWASSFGPGWDSFDHLVDECLRLGLVCHASLFVSWSDSGAAPELSSATNANLQQVGVDLANRYPVALYPNIVWHVMFDTGDNPGSTIGARTKALFAGINSVEGTDARLRWMEPSSTGTTQTSGWYNDTDMRPSMDSLYLYTNNSTEAVENIYADNTGTTPTFYTDDTDYPIGDCEPPYDGATHYSGNQGQQLRERSFALALEGGVLINYGHENWWTFGFTGLFTGDVADWTEVQAHDHTVQQSYIWAIVDQYVEDTTWVPSGWVTTGQGSGDTKASCGNSNTAALAYIPSNRSVTVDTTVITGTANVSLRWYDPTNGTYSTISSSEAQNSSRSVTMPSARGDGTSDFLLVVELATMHVGEATGTVSWNGVATGARTSIGSATGSITWAGSSTGSEPAKGAASGTIAWTGSASGTRTPKGSASGSITWAGVAVGANLGVAIGSIAWVGSATGTRQSRGASSGAISWVGSAAGFAPTVGINDGSASGAISWVGSATGTRTPKASASSTITWAGVVVGGNLGVVVGSINWVGSATGEAPELGISEGEAVGTITWVGVALGDNGEAIVGFIAGNILGPAISKPLIFGPAVRRVVTGPNVSRVTTGPDLVIEDLDGPDRNIEALDGPDVSRVLMGPATNRAVTGPES